MTKQALLYLRFIAFLLLIIILLQLINLTFPEDAPFHYMLIQHIASADQLMEVPLVYPTVTPRTYSKER